MVERWVTPGQPRPIRARPDRVHTLGRELWRWPMRAEMQRRPASAPHKKALKHKKYKYVPVGIPTRYLNTIIDSSYRVHKFGVVCSHPTKRGEKCDELSEDGRLRSCWLFPCLFQPMRILQPVQAATHATPVRIANTVSTAPRMVEHAVSARGIACYIAIEHLLRSK